MLTYHMAVVTRDSALRRGIKRLTTATASSAQSVRDPAELAEDKDIDLVIHDARSRVPDRALFDRLTDRSRVIHIVDGDTLIKKVELLADPRVCSLVCHDARFDDDELIASATKALRGDVFGLQKYFPWGVTTYTMAVGSYEEKGRAIELLGRYAQLAGVRGPVRERIQLVADELMMNALYHAPTDDDGNELYRGRSLKELAQLESVSPIQIQYGCSGRYFGISVRDSGGSLTRDRALEYLRRAGRREAQIEAKPTGAGLGLVSVLKSVSKLILNIEPGYSTEVIGLFDVELFAKGKIGARSLHLFIAEPEPDTQDDADTGEIAAAMVAPRPGRAWPMAAVVLTMVLTVLATAYYYRNLKPHHGRDPGAAVAAELPTLTVVPVPADATITIDGEPAAANLAIPITGADPMVVEVTMPGFEPYTRSFSAGELATSVKVFVSLQREPSRKEARRRRSP